MLTASPFDGKCAFNGYHSLSGGVMGRTICGKGGPYVAAIVGPVGPTMAPDQI